MFKLAIKRHGLNTERPKVSAEAFRRPGATKEMF
jgi:hypothetical protein